MENSKEPGKKKIKEEDLGTISGGCGKKKPEPKPIDPHDDITYTTTMRCQNYDNCDFLEYRPGNWKDGKNYLCPKCDNLTLRGIVALKN